MFASLTILPTKIVVLLLKNSYPDLQSVQFQLSTLNSFLVPCPLVGDITGTFNSISLIMFGKKLFYIQS